MTAIGPGVRVKCIKRGKWELVFGTPAKRAPVYGEICTVSELYKKANGDWISLEGYDPDDTFDVTRFRPLDGIDDLAELIREAKNPDAPTVPVREREFVVVRP